MKKLLAILICAFMCIAAFTACGIFKHEHTKSDWKQSETEHWRVPECDRSDCAVEEVVYDLGEHIDEDENDICDVCGYEYVFIFKLKYDESGCCCKNASLCSISIKCHCCSRMAWYISSIRS